VREGRLYVGEAAGFQDCLFGFGMRYALLSGALAARAIAEAEDYDHLWQSAFGHQLSVGTRNRRLYSRFGNPGYEAMLRILASRNPVVVKLRQGRDARELLAHVYNRQIPRIYRIGALLAQAFARAAARRENSRRKQGRRLRLPGQVIQDAPFASPRGDSSTSEDADAL
jgi:flavin-dependent dehydrogenase